MSVPASDSEQPVTTLSVRARGRGEPVSECGSAERVRAAQLRPPRSIGASFGSTSTDTYLSSPAASATVTNAASSADVVEDTEDDVGSDEDGPFAPVPSHGHP